MSSNACINPEAIEALRAVSPDDGGAFLTELIDIYLADTPPRIADLRRGLETADANLVVRASHAIKGSSGNFGAETLARLAGEIEQSAKKGDLTVATEHCPQLEAEFEAVRLALVALRQA